MSGMDSDSFRVGFSKELRLHLAESFIENETNLIAVTATKEEWQALMNWLEREFIPHDNYEEIHNVLKTINGKLAR